MAKLGWSEEGRERREEGVGEIVSNSVWLIYIAS